MGHKVFLSLLLLGVPLGAAESGLDAVRLTQRRLGMAVLADTAPREDVMLALAEAGNRAASGNVPSDWKGQDYDALYALLQQYREELKALGLKNLDAQLFALKAKSYNVHDAGSQRTQLTDPVQKTNS